MSKSKQAVPEPVAGGDARSTSRYRPIVPAVEQAAQVLRLLGETSRTGLTLTQVCNRAGLSKSKGYTILNTLVQYGLVERDDPTKTYTLGFGLVVLARNVLDNLDLRDMAAAALQALAEETRTTALLGVVSGDHVYVAAKREGAQQDIGVTIRLGHRFPLTHGAHGKAIVACLPSDRQHEILAGERLYFHGRPENLDRPRLERELAASRVRGYATDAGEGSPGINAVSAPLRAPGGLVPGCLILIGTFPEAHLTDYGARIAAAAREISERLGAGVP